MNDFMEFTADISTEQSAMSPESLQVSTTTASNNTTSNLSPTANEFDVGLANALKIWQGTLYDMSLFWKLNY